MYEGSFQSRGCPRFSERSRAKPDSIRSVKRVTLKDVAQRAGVTAAAASLAMSGKGRISPETRDRIQRAMEELGYVYHRGAASLRTQKSSIVGLLVTDISNPFFSNMTVGFEEQLGQDGYLTVLANTFDDPGRQSELLRVLTEQSVDAVVYVPAMGGDSSFAVPGKTNNPALAVTRRQRPDVPYLGPDDRAGGRLAAQHVVQVHGRKRLVYLGGPSGAWTREERLTGVSEYINGMGEVSLAAEFSGRTSIGSGLELANRLMDAGKEFDAVICHSDVVAFSFIRAYLDRGGGPLADISVIGFDGLPESAVYNPPLTTVSVGPEELGRRAARLIQELINGQEVGVELMPPVLQVRDSCGCNPTS